MQAQILMLNQDDPKKCTAAKLVRFGLAKRTRYVPRKTILLDPYSQRFLTPLDKHKSHSITAVDCSWNKASEAFTNKMNGIPRKLPPLFAGNPVNFSKIGKLTSAEALAGALYILGHETMSSTLLDKFKWGHTFLELNQYLLQEYTQLTTEEDINTILKEYNIV